MAEKRAARGEAIRLRAAQQLKQQQTQLEQLEQQQQATAAQYDSAIIMHERSTQLQVRSVACVCADRYGEDRHAPYRHAHT